LILRLAEKDLSLIALVAGKTKINLANLVTSPSREISEIEVFQKVDYVVYPFHTRSIDAI